MVPRVVLDRHAVTLGLGTPGYDTLQLAAAVRTSLGAPIAGAPAVRYDVALGDTSVRVSETGLLRAHAPTTGVIVIATVTVGGTTVRDSVRVTVNDLHGTTPRVDHLAFGPTPGIDSVASCGSPFPGGPTVAAVTADGDTIPNIAVALTSSDEGRASISPQASFNDAGVSTGVSALLVAKCQTIGPVWIRASATIYGVTVVDSTRSAVTAPAAITLAYRVATDATAPSFLFFEQGRDAALAPITIAAGATVVWFNLTDTPFDVVFDDPSQASALTETWQSTIGLSIPPNGGGNIALFDPDPSGIVPANARTRRFLTPGTVRFHTTQSSARGTLIVVAAF